MGRQPIRRDVALWVAGSLLTIAAVPLVVVAQHALDMNLRVGSNGYNRPLPRNSMMSSQRYTPGSGKSLYVVSATGEMVYSPNNAFFPRQRYTATGYNATYQSPGWNTTFRWQDQY
jgi:hypothetical protein